MAHYQQRDYEAALAWSRKAVGHNPKHVIALRYLLASLAKTGALEEAQSLARRVSALDPSENVSFFRRRAAYVDPRRIEHLCEGLRLGGLPESA
jgi:tetratricopeptide (TPR) repeat protein